MVRTGGTRSAQVLVKDSCRDWFTVYYYYHYYHKFTQGKAGAAAMTEKYTSLVVGESSVEKEEDEGRQHEK